MSASSDNRRSRPSRLRVPPEDRRRRPRRRPLSTDRIVDVALAQMRDGGYEAVSMRSIARELGTGPASLYAHVASRDELDTFVVVRVVSMLDVPDPDPDHWREQLRDVMFAMLRLYDEHPGVARASLGLVPLSPVMLRVMERIMAITRTGGAPDQAIAWFMDMMALYVGGVALERDIERTRRSSGGDPRTDYDRVHDFFAGLSPAEFPVLSSMAGALTAGDGDDRFGFGVDLMIAGLSAFASGTVRLRHPRLPGRGADDA